MTQSPPPKLIERSEMLEKIDECKHKWRYVFGLNGEPHCIRIYDCDTCGAQAELKTPKSKNGEYGKGVLTITPPKSQPLLERSDSLESK
jgi:hypothetical protein